MGAIVRSGDDVKENDLLIDVPLKYVLCRPTLTQFKGSWGAALKETFEQFKHDDVPGIALALMLSRSSETTNRWKPWTALLPKQFDGALYFEQRLLDLLPVRLCVVRFHRATLTCDVFFSESIAKFDKKDHRICGGFFCESLV